VFSSQFLHDAHQVLSENAEFIMSRVERTNQRFKQERKEKRNQYGIILNLFNTPPLIFDLLDQGGCINVTHI
jgi:hypothetical protein